MEGEVLTGGNRCYHPEAEALCRLGSCVPQVDFQGRDVERICAVSGRTDGAPADDVSAERSEDTTSADEAVAEDTEATEEAGSEEEAT